MIKKLILASVIATMTTASQAVEFNEDLSSCSGNTISIALDNANGWDNNNLEFYVFARDKNGDYDTKRKVIKPGNIATDGSLSSVRFWTLDDIEVYSVFSFDEGFTPKNGHNIYCN